MSYRVVETARSSAPDDVEVPHEIYRRLVAPIPLGMPVSSCVAGLVWTLVQAGGHRVWR